MRESNFVFDYVQLLYDKFHKINLNRDGSYIDAPDWIINKKLIINIFNKKGNKYFQYAGTVTLNYEKIKNDPQKITKIKAFSNKYNWEGMNYPSQKYDSKKSEKNNVTNILNILYARKGKNVSFLCFKT